MSTPLQQRPLLQRGLYAITPTDLAGQALLDAVRAVIEGGAVAIQYRAKDRASRRDAEALQSLCAQLGVPLIVNDHPELAADVGAAGVHIGRDDGGLEAARRRVGDGCLIGVSCYDSLERAREAVAQGADYVAFGRFFPSRSKPEAVPAPLSLLTRARAELCCPIVAIGGITPENGGGLITAGADLLAAIEGVFGAADRRQAARWYAELITRTT